jgi:Methyltransferase domain
LLRFVKTFIVPLLDGKRWRTVCEIGASMGGGTDLLASVPHAAITVIDPCFDCDLAEKYGGNPRVSVRKGTSLEILPKLNGAFDCILIDGDHNWYTVYQELKTISERRLLRPGGIVFFHDVDWPWGRRDMYYQPEVIPPEYVHNWKLQGIVPGKSEVSEEISTLAYLKKASHEGGARNGVLTAIEDFLKEHRGQYRFFRVRAGVGLGVMQYRGSFRDRLTFLFLEFKGAACNLALWLKQLVKPVQPGLLGEDSPSAGTS